MGRSPCCDEKIHVKKGPWTPEEDKKLVDYIALHGHRSWRHLPKNAGLNRCGKSCRLRWTNYLRPDIRRGNFSPDEESQIIHLHSLLGNKWSKISMHLPGRTDNEIKNYWNTHLRKKLLAMGVDPATHRRRADLDIVLSTLLTAATGSLVGSLAAANPRFDIAALRAQADAAQYLARLQALENLVKLVNPNPAPPPSMEAVINHLFAERQIDNPVLNVPNPNEMATTMEKLNHVRASDSSSSEIMMDANSGMLSGPVLSGCLEMQTHSSTPPPLLASASPDEKYEVAECSQEEHDQQIKFPTFTSHPDEDFSSWKDILEQLSWSDE